MRETIFLRLLSDSDKGAGLRRSIEVLREGNFVDAVSYLVDPQSFRRMPGSPFAYWVSARIRELFNEFPPFEGEGRAVRVGLQTSDDFRFLRAWWEVPQDRIPDAANGPRWREDLQRFQDWCRRQTFEGKRWVPLAKGGEYSPYYADIHLVVNWERNGEEMKAWADPLYDNSGWSRIIKSVEFYFRPAITWPERTTSGYCPQAMPAGTIFSVTGQAMLPDDSELLLPLLAVHSTRTYQYLVELMIGLGEESVSGSAARHYTAGTVKRLPFDIRLALDRGPSISERASKMIKIRQLDAASSEPSWAFQIAMLSNGSLSTAVMSGAEERLANYLTGLRLTAETEGAVRIGFGLSDREVREIISVVGPHPVLDLPERNPDEVSDQVREALVRSIDDVIDEAVRSGLASRAITKKSYFVSRLHELLAQRCGCSALTIVEAHRRLGSAEGGELKDSAKSLISLAIGCAFGRWDARMLLDKSLIPEMPDAFDPLPICPPLMLVGPDGLPASRNRIASEEWLRARHEAGRLPDGGRISQPSITEARYPLRVAWDGILVDEPGLDGSVSAECDVAGQIRHAVELLYGEGAPGIEDEVCGILGVPGLREYIRRPNGFFEDHLRRYSRSRRLAPIYWPLSTASGGYTVWIYYHRLDDDLLYKAVNEHVTPKMEEMEQRILQLEKEQAGMTAREATKLAGQLTELEGFRRELKELREELLRVAALPYRPNRNDGVVITAAPLWRLFRLPRWRKELEHCWRALEKGEYDWAHLAYAIWPERVRDRCRQDRSIAIAHGLEGLYKGGETVDRKRRQRESRQ